MRIRHAAAAAFAAVLLSAAAAGAQRQAPERVQARGTVVDSRSGTPIEGAIVDVARLRRSGRTDERGAFDLGRVQPGTYAATVKTMGYGVSELDLVVSASGEARIALESDPILLEAITATADRFESRRRAAGVSSRVVAKRDLALSAAPNLSEYIEQVGVGSNARSRSPLVFVDEVPAMGGLAMLASYDPWEIERVEIYGSGGQIRVYTTWFMEHAAKRRYRPQPFLL